MPGSKHVLIRGQPEPRFVGDQLAGAERIRVVEDRMGIRCTSNHVPPSRLRRVRDPEGKVS